MDNESIVKDARSKFERDKKAWGDNYDKAADDMRFQSDEKYAQWDEADAKKRTDRGAPAITIDQLNQFIHQVANDIRMNTPTINVIPGKGGDEETAEVFKEKIRDIEYNSNADAAYDTAALNAVRCGIGFIRVDHDYVDDEGFDQELEIKRVTNPLACWIDCESVEPDGRDAQHGTIIDSMSVETFKRKYPNKEPVCFENGETNKELKDEEFISIAEHFVLIHEEREIGVDDNGGITEEITDLIKRKRTIKKTKVARYKLSGKEVLEETTFPGRYIPLVPVYGEELWIEGERHLLSLIRKSKEAQKMYNYWASLETELLMKAPKAPVVAVGGSVENYIEDWTNPDKAAVLRYDAIDKEGRPVPPPNRLEPPTVPMGVVNARREALDDIKATMGLYNASIGQKSNETSGIAIQRRQQEGDVATFHFSDNLVRSITQVGRILVCAMPTIYDTPRILRVISTEDDAKEIGINGARAEGQEETVDLSKGIYSVRVTTGAPFTTRRQEAAAFFSDVVTRQPDLMTVMGDLLFKNMDIAGAEAMANRMRKLIDPKLLDDNENDPEKMALLQQIEEAKMIMQGMQQEVGKLQEQLNDKKAELEIKAQAEMSDSEEARAKLEIQALELQIKSKQADAEIELRRAELALKAKELEIKEAQTIADNIMQTELAKANAPANEGGAF